MDGSQWLDRVFAPALDDAAGSTLYVVQAQVHALRERGVLDAGQAADAWRRIEAARPVIEPPASAARRPVDRLVRVLTLAPPLTDIDGETSLLTSDELWEHSVAVFVAGVPNVDTIRREQQAQAALERWARQRQSGSDTPFPPRRRCAAARSAA